MLLKVQNISEEAKENKRWNGYQWYKNLPEDEPQRLVEYRKKVFQEEKIKPLHKEWLMFLVSKLKYLIWNRVRKNILLLRKKWLRKKIRI